MAFSRFLFSSYRSFKAAVPSFIRRHPIVTTAVSYLGISYAARPLIRHFNTDEQNANADDHLRPFRATDVFYPGRMLGRVMFSMIDRHVNVRETEEAIVLRYCGLSDVKKEDVKVFVDRNILKIEDTFPGHNRFSGTLDLVEKNCDRLHTTAKFENNVLEIVIPKTFRATDVFYPGRMLGRVMFSMIDRHVNMRETEEAVVLRYCVLSDVKKEDVKVFLDRNILKIEDTFPNRNRFSGTLDLAGKNLDGVHTTAKFENNVLEIVIPKKLKNEEDEDEDLMVHVHVINVE